MLTNIYSLLFICIICIGGEQSPCKLIVLAPSKISEIYTKKHVLFAARCAFCDAHTLCCEKHVLFRIDF